MYCFEVKLWKSFKFFGRIISDVFISSVRPWAPANILSSRKWRLSILISFLFTELTVPSQLNWNTTYKSMHICTHTLRKTHTVWYILTYLHHTALLWSSPKEPYLSVLLYLLSTLNLFLLTLLLRLSFWWC